jgi:hypothetical protein
MIIRIKKLVGKEANEFFCNLFGRQSLLALCKNIKKIETDKAAGKILWLLQRKRLPCMEAREPLAIVFSFYIPNPA